ncbi:MAG: SAM-dependent methyltransferase [Alphaproteobacteria bacterium]
MNRLEADLKRRIERDGPIPVSEFMAFALGHSEHGYYIKKDPFGAAGDFITAPEISQCFGELVGVWAVAIWHMAGRPDPVTFVELGPGRGTLMADALRAASQRPDFLKAVRVHLVETSPVLRQSQEKALVRCELPTPPAWHDSLDTVPAGPAIIVANEFFDALPIRQIVQTEAGWRERMVGLVDGDLTFLADAHTPDMTPMVPARLRSAARPGDLFEICPAAETAIESMARRIASDGLSALFFDYGHAQSALGDTFQAVHHHESVDVLSSPGDVDLTAHVDFEALADSANRFALCHGPVTQGDFLRRLGIEVRRDTLVANATPQQADLVRSGVHRLTAADEMGTLVKVLAVTPRGVGAPPGFEG